MSQFKSNRYATEVAALWALIAVFVVGWPRGAQTQPLSELLEEARNFEDRVSRLEDQYLKPAILESRYKLETRFNDGRVAYMLEDFDRASLLLVDIVRHPRFGEFESRREVLYMLGDSLYQRRNYLSAKKYFQQIVDEGRGKHFQDAIVSLLEIAAKTGDYSDVDHLYEQFDSQRQVSPGVNYIRGKTLFRQGSPDRAVPFLNRAMESDKWEYRARYLKGVCLADQKKYQEARDVFSNLAGDIDPKTEQARNILHLSFLARGRVAYEQGKLEEAIDLYQRLPRSSDHFDRALYELTWVLVSRKSYEEASRNADIFLYLSNPDPTFIPEIKLLKADLLLRLDKYKESTAAYREVIKQFKPVRREIHTFLSERENLRDFFRNLVDDELSGDNPTYLPNKVQKWIDKGGEMKKVRRTIEDVSQLEEDLQRTREALAQVEARVTSGSSVKSFPTLAEGMAVGIQAENELIQLRESLLEKEYKLLAPVMSAEEKSEWRAMREDLSKFQERYKKVPKTASEVQKREKKVQKKFEKLREELDAVAYQLDGQRDQLESVNKYIREHYDGELPESKKREVAALREEVRQNIKELSKREEKLRQRIAVARQKVGVGDQVTEKESKLRDEYRDKLSKRRAFLEDLHGRVGSGKRSKLDRIQQARSQLPPAYARLQGFFKRMEKVVTEKSTELQETIARERKLLERRASRLEQLTQESKKTATKVAYTNFVEVKRKFDEIVLRGDVGLIDVAWSKKEGKTDDLNQLRENRRSALKALQQSFEEVR